MMADHFVEAVRHANLIVFILLAVQALRSWRKRRGAAAAWMAVTYGTLAAVSLAARLLPDHSSDERAAQYVAKATIFGLSLFPYALYRFTATFRRPSRRTEEWLALALATMVAGWTLVLPRFPGSGREPGWFRAYVCAFFLYWIALSLLSAWRLWRGGRAQPGVTRNRMRLLGLGAVTLTVAVLMSGLTPAKALGPWAGAQITGLVSALFFFLGFAPTATLRGMWRRRELEAFHRAEAGLIGANTVDSVAEVILPHAARLMGGQSAFLADGGREVIAVYGMTIAEAATAAGRLGPSGRKLSHSILAFPMQSGWLAVQTSPYTPFFGRDELSLLEALGHSADLALERARLFERERASRVALREREKQLAQAQELAHLGSWEWDVEPDHLTISDELYNLFALDYLPPEPSYDLLLERVHPDDRDRMAEAALRVWATREPFVVDCRMLLPSGEVRWVQARGQVVLDDGDRPRSVQGTVQDITDQKRAERELLSRARQQAAVARLGQRALEGGDLATLMQEAAGLVGQVLDVEFSRVLELVTDPPALLLRAGVGWRDGQVGAAVVPVGTRSHAGYALDIGRPVVMKDARTETRFEIAGILADHNVISGVSVTIPGHDEPFGVLSADSSTLRAFSRQDIDFLLAIANVLATAIERHRVNDRLSQLALHDPLTGLPNRALVMDRLGQALARAQRQESSLALFFLDLDRFKVVNDGLGHSAGDQLLIAVAARLKAVVRPTDTVARFGGDEFVILSEDVPDRDHAAIVAERIADALARPVSVAGREVPVTVSIGMVITNGEHDDPESLIRDADVAMYRAKERGRARYELFDSTMRERVTERLETEAALRLALARDELRVLYQPEFSLRDGSIVGVEALLRWDHPDRGLLTPAEFLSLAEDTGLIVPMGMWALGEACRQAQAWREDHGDLDSFTVWVNFSARQLTQPDIPEIVADIVSRTLVDPTRLGIEITESVLMEDLEAVGSALRGLKQLGVQLAIDDFGTGFSSLSFLKRFPVGVLKVDRSFVAGLGRDPGDSAIVRAVIGLAHSLGLVAVAEGVKTPEQLSTLRSWGCDVAQGYHLGVPSDARTIDALLRRSRRRARADAEVDRGWDELQEVPFEHLDAALVAAPLQA